MAMAIDVEAEIRDLKRRVSEIEGSFGFLTQQIKGVHKDLLDFEAKTEQSFEKVDKRFGQVDKRFEQVDKRFDRLEQKVDGLAKAMPGIVGDEIRQALREDRERKR